MSPRAPSPAAGIDPRHVVAIAYDRLCTFELGIAVEIFGLPRPEVQVPWYTFRVCSLDPGELRATGGIRVRAGGRARRAPAGRHHRHPGLAGP